MNLYPHQKECLECLKNSEQKAKLVVLPTGSGKTRIFLSYLANKKKRALVIAHTIELIQQTKESLEKNFPETTCKIISSDELPSSEIISISTVQCISLMLRKGILDLSRFDILVIDEAHRTMAESYLRIINEMPENAEILGFTATPVRMDRKDLSIIFGKPVYSKTIHDMIQKGILCDVRLFRIQTGVSLETINSHNGDFKTKELAAVINTQERNQLAVKTYLELLKDKKTIIFCCDVVHVLSLKKEFEKKGIPVGYVVGCMSEKKRKETLVRFKTGEIKVIINCQLLTEGFDEPSTEALLIARPTQSVSLYTQIIGRGLRTFPGKTDCMIADLTDNSNVIATMEDVFEIKKGSRLKDGEKVSEQIEKNPKMLQKSDGSIVAQPVNFLKKRNAKYLPLSQNQINYMLKKNIYFAPKTTYDSAAKKILKFNQKWRI